ncbi:hypothetical protein TI05_14315 [Achromatium sp. WMS3]|nr:hypothetical protein TI05_14315 [Achromatium sp. WMS3]
MVMEIRKKRAARLKKLKLPGILSIYELPKAKQEHIFRLMDDITRLEPYLQRPGYSEAQITYFLEEIF